MTKYVIIGSCHCGTIASITIRQKDPKADITIIEMNDTVSFLSCGIALAIEKVSSSLDAMFYNSIENLTKMGIKVLYKHEVTTIDYTAQSLSYRNNTTQEMGTIAYDKLLISSGSRPINPFKNLEVDNKHIFYCKNYNDAKKLVELKSNGDKSVAIIGSGYIGVELAEAFAVQKFKVSIIEKAPRILERYFSKETTDVLEGELKKHGVEVIVGTDVNGVTAKGEKVEIALSSGAREVDYCIVCVGFRPNTGFAVESSKGALKTIGNGAILVDERQRTSIKNVFAAGDAATHKSMLTGEMTYVPLATVAVKQALIAGLNMITEEIPLVFPGQLGTSMIKIFDYQVAMVGISNPTDMEKYGLIQHSDNWRPEFIPDNKHEVKLTLVYQKDTDQVVGAQLMSCVDVSQIINIISLAIGNKMTIPQLLLSDFFFNPWSGKPLHIIQSTIATRFFEQSFEEKK